jgi:hypothetical protein
MSFSRNQQRIFGAQVSNGVFDGLFAIADFDGLGAMFYNLHS